MNDWNSPQTITIPLGVELEDTTKRLVSRGCGQEEVNESGGWGRHSMMVLVVVAYGTWGKRRLLLLACIRDCIPNPCFYPCFLRAKLLLLGCSADNTEFRAKRPIKQHKSLEFGQKPAETAQKSVIFPKTTSLQTLCPPSQSQTNIIFRQCLKIIEPDWGRNGPNGSICLLLNWFALNS